MQESECVDTTSNIDVADSESNEILRFELLRNELIELEKRVQRSANQSESEEVFLILLSCLYTIRNIAKSAIRRWMMYGA